MFKVFSTDHLRKVFEEENKYESFRQIASGLINGTEMFELDDNGNERRISVADANKAVRKIFMEICGLSEEDLSSKKRRERAEEAHMTEIYEIIEEDIDLLINRGLQENEWFNQFVEMKSHALGDANAFHIEENQYLIVGDVSGDHHDVTIQQLGAGSDIMVKCTSHAIKIGKDIDLIILGRYDYSKMVRKIAEAFERDIQNRIFADVYAAADKLPVGSNLKMTTALAAGTKADFDNLIENVEVYNDSRVVIMGTKVALKKLTAVTDVDWATLQQKEDIMRFGRLGMYEGVELVELPQRLALGDGFTKLLPNDVMLIIPVKEDKFVKFYDEGETEIFELREKGDHKDDFQTHEVHRTYGSEIVLGQYFGVYDEA